METIRSQQAYQPEEHALVGSWNNGQEPDSHVYYQEQLYRDTQGIFFLCQSGGCESPARSAADPLSSCRVVRLSYAKAKAWGMKHLTHAVCLNLFGTQTKRRKKEEYLAG